MGKNMEETKTTKIKKILNQKPYNIINDRCFVFHNNDVTPSKTANPGLVGILQDFFKKFSFIYYTIIHLFSPAIPTIRYIKTVNKMKRKYSSDHMTILNLCSGPHQLFNRDDILNVDLFAFKNVDICADACNLPIKDNSVDMIFLLSGLEHIPKYYQVINEMHRILKSDGEFIAFIPFIYPFHASPCDYNRWTKSGLKNIFSNFTKISVISGYGPTTGLLAVFQEYVASALSFGNQSVHDLLYIFLLLVTWPVKFLDWILEFNHLACNNSGGFVVSGKK